MQVYVCVYVSLPLLPYITYAILEETQAHEEDFMLLYLMCAWCCSSFSWYSSFKTGCTAKRACSRYTCSPALLPASRSQGLHSSLCDEDVPKREKHVLRVLSLMALREDAQQQWSLQLIFSAPAHMCSIVGGGVISHCPDKWVTICAGSICVWIHKHICFFPHLQLCRDGMCR